MAFPETPLRIKDRFPSLAVIEGELFPTAKANRTSISEYERALELRGELTDAVKDSIAKARGIREQTRAVIYVAGPLTGVDEKTKMRYKEISDLLDNYGYIEAPGDEKTKLFFGYVPHLHGTDPVKHPNVSPNEVRAIDHLWAVVVADFHVNFLHPVAHGNAIEEGWAEDHMIPTAYQNQKGNKLSRLVLGMDNIASRNEYDEFNIDGLGQLRILLDEYAAWLKTFQNRDAREFWYMSTAVLNTPVARTPLLIENALDPNRFNPIFAVDQFLIYIKDPKHRRYGQVGQLKVHDWREGFLLVSFADGWDQFSDEGAGISWWVK